MVQNFFYRIQNDKYINYHDQFHFHLVYELSFFLRYYLKLKI